MKTWDKTVIAAAPRALDALQITCYQGESGNKDSVHGKGSSGFFLFKVYKCNLSFVSFVLIKVIKQMLNIAEKMKIEEGSSTPILSVKNYIFANKIGTNAHLSSL